MTVHTRKLSYGINAVAILNRIKKALPLCLAGAIITALQSCDFHDIGPKDYRISLPQPSEPTWTVDRDGISGQDGSYAQYPIKEGATLNYICCIAINSSDSTKLARVSDGSQLASIPYIMPEYVIGNSDKVNLKYRHFVNIPQEDIVGKHIDDIKEQWGDNLFLTNLTDAPAGPNRIYTFPHIMLMGKGRYMNGVKLYTDLSGTITSIEPRLGIQRNLFGALPFYENILAANLMEWIMPGPWVEKTSDVPSRGVFASIAYPLIIFFLVVALLSAICCAIYIPLDRISPRMGIVKWPLIILTFMVEYCCLISLLDYYSAGWWATVLLLIGLSAAPLTYLMLGSRKYCPKCKGYKWDENCFIVKVERPIARFEQKWSGSTLYIEADNMSRMKITRCTRSKCKSCGHTETTEYTSEEYRNRTLCPKCFNETVRWEVTKPTIINEKVEANCEEWCTSPGCDYRFLTHVSGKYSKKPEPLRPRPAKKKNVHQEENKRKGPCRYCEYVHNYYGEGFGTDEHVCTRKTGTPPCHYYFDEQEKCTLYNP